MHSRSVPRLTRTPFSDVQMGIEVEKFEDIKDDVDFTQKLLAEECILVLPGTIFQIPNYVRLVSRPPTHAPCGVPRRGCPGIWG